MTYIEHRPPSPSTDTIAHQIAVYGYNRTEASRLNEINEEEKRKRYLRRNLETTINHVYDDSAVSFTNQYQLSPKGEITTYPDNIPLHIDPEERGGLYSFGLVSAVGAALDNPSQVVVYYSPAGPVVFDDNQDNKYKDVERYDIGQLYLMYSDPNSETVNTVTVSVSQEGESWVETIMPAIYHEAKSKPDEIAKVGHFITHPVLTGHDIEDFLTKMTTQDNQIIYRNKDGARFSLYETTALIRRSLTNTLPHSSIVDAVMDQVDITKVSRADIDFIYQTAMILYMKQKGLTDMALGGSCGGKTVSLDSLSGYDISTLSSDFRTLTQGGLDKLLETKNDTAYFICPKCGGQIESGKGISVCPHCGVSKEQYAKEKGSPIC
ncbi:MAG: hypothetical protein WC489_01010 [Patescibacteria group bacterium]